jgi:hypothetical protein
MGGEEGSMLGGGDCLHKEWVLSYRDIQVEFYCKQEDQMVFGIVRWEAGPRKKQPKALKLSLPKEDHQSRVHSD